MNDLFLAIWFLVFCSASSFASPVGDDINKPSDARKTTTSSNQTVSSSSKPPSNLKKGRSSVSSSEDIPPAKISRYQSDEDKDAALSVDEVYQNQVEISKSFLDPKKCEGFSKRGLGKLECDYEYNRKEQTLDISYSSARDRIYCLSKIINLKIGFLPEYEARTNEDFKHLELPNNAFWSEVKSTGKRTEIVDRLPTTFKIGKFKYRLVGGVTVHQKGGGGLYGLIKENSAEKHSEIHEWLQKRKDKLHYYSKLLSQQKESGIPIDTGDIEEGRFLNGLNLLLDYEVARRLVAGDSHQDLPVISYMNFIINNLDKFEELMVGKKESAWGISRKPWQKWDYNLSLVIGDKRDAVAKAFIPRLTSTKSSAAMRHDLANLHQDDEDSGGEYSGSGDEDEISFYPETKLTTQQDQQLKALAAEYRRNLRNANLQVGEVLSSGDLELEILADLLELNVNVYHWEYDSMGRVRKDSHKKRIIIKNQLTIGPKSGKPVNLFLLSKRHYHHYIIYNHEVGQTESLENIPSNVCNSLFSVLLRAQRSKILPYYDDVIVTIKEISDLRDQVANILEDKATNGDDRIYNQFVDIFTATNKEEYQMAVSSLPSSSLRDKVIKLRKISFSKQPQDLAEEKDIEKESREIAEQSGTIGPRDIPGWILQDVADKGNCFYEAVADQLRIINHDFIREVPVGTLLHDSLRLRIQRAQGEEFIDRKWADDYATEILAREFGVVVAIVDTTYRAGRQNYRFGYYYINAEGAFASTPDVATILPVRPIIRLAYTGNHYLSVVSTPEDMLQSIPEQSVNNGSFATSLSSSSSSASASNSTSGSGSTLLNFDLMPTNVGGVVMPSIFSNAK